MSTLAELPKVEGQHRNRALAAARKVKAVELRTAGRTYDQIATELGYANRGTVHRIIADALEAQTVEATQELRDLERSRLDALQYALWDQAMAGDIHAARTAVRIIKARCRLLGLDQSKLFGDERQWPRTVVAPPGG